MEERTPFREGLSLSTASIASSIILPIVGCFALFLRCSHRASFGTQKTFSALYSSGSSGSAPKLDSLVKNWFFSSKASEIYLRNIKPRTTCLYSAASMLFRSLSAVCQSFSSKPRFAPLPLGLFFAISHHTLLFLILHRCIIQKSHWNKLFLYIFFIYLKFIEKFSNGRSQHNMPRNRRADQIPPAAPRP